MLKALQVVRFFTVLIFLGTLLASYAYVPLTLDIHLDDVGRISRSFYFYLAIGVFIVFNLSSYFLRFYVDRIGAKEEIKVCVHALAPVLFFSLSLLMGYVTVINNAEDVRPSTYSYLNYLAVGLILAWIFSFLFFLVKKK